MDNQYEDEEVYEDDNQDETWEDLVDEYTTDEMMEDEANWAGC